MDGGAEAHRGPWSCLKPWTLLSIHGSWLSGRGQRVPRSGLAVRPTRGDGEDTCRAWAVASSPAQPRGLPRSLLSGSDSSLPASPPSWGVGSWNHVGGSPTGLSRTHSWPREQPSLHGLALAWPFIGRQPPALPAPAPASGPGAAEQSSSPRASAPTSGSGHDFLIWPLPRPAPSVSPHPRAAASGNGAPSFLGAAGDARPPLTSSALPQCDPAMRSRKRRAPGPCSLGPAAMQAVRWGVGVRKGNPFFCRQGSAGSA